MLTDNQLVIADAGKPVAIAGVMGGEYSGIVDDTTTIVFESANFLGSSVRITARDQGMRTDASSRYEKGLDPNNCIPALNRACELVELLDARRRDGWHYHGRSLQGPASQNPSGSGLDQPVPGFEPFGRRNESDSVQAGLPVRR